MLWVLGLLALATLAHGAANPVDLCYGIDLGDTSQAEWNKMLDYAAEYAAVLIQAKPGSRIGLVVGNDEAAFLVLKLNDHKDLASIQATIRSIPYQVNPGRDLSKILFNIHEHCMNAKNGAQPGAADGAVLITDGISDPASDKHDADILKATGCLLTVIGVGIPENQRAHLTAMASPPDAYFIDTYDQLTTDLTCGITPCKLPTLNSITLSNPIIFQHHFYFQCRIDYDLSFPNVRCAVEFLVDGNMIPGTLTELSSPANTHVLNDYTIRGHLGGQVTCRSYCYKTTNPQRRSPILTSNQYFAGIKLSLTTITMNEQNQASMMQTVEAHSTVPILCKWSTTCTLKFVVTTAKFISVGQDVANFQLCYFILTHVNYFPDGQVATNKAAMVVVPVSVATKSTAKEVGVITLIADPVRYDLDPSFSHGTGIPPGTIYSPFDGCTVIITVILHRHGVPGTCSSSGDPHIKGYDGWTHHVYGNGPYQLTDYQPGWGAVFVQQKHHCPTPGCKAGLNCAVAVYESTGWATGKTTIVDLCSKTLRHLKCDRDGVPTSVKKDNGKKVYEIMTTVGISVVVKVIGTSRIDIFVKIPSTFKGKTMRGLCGNYNGNKNDEKNKDPLSYFISGAKKNFFNCDMLPIQTGPAFARCRAGKVNKRSVTSGPPKPIVQEGQAAITDLEESSTSRALIPSFVIDEMRQAGDDVSSYTDDIEDDYAKTVEDENVFVTRDLTDPPTWGTFDVTEEEAELACQQALQNSPSYATCVPIVSTEDMRVIVAVCKLDIELTGDLVWTEGVAEALQDKCLNTIKATSDVKDPTDVTEDPEFIKKVENFLVTTCTNACSGHGTCTGRGGCDCDKGYIGDDCSLEAGTPPNVLSYKGQDLCDVTEKPCSGVFVIAENVVESDTLTCKAVINTVDTSTEYTRPAIVYSNDQVKCQLPAFKDMDTLAYVYSVMLSNDGETYSTVNGDNGESRVVWSSDLMWLECLYKGVMVPKNESCAILGECYLAGHQKDNNYVCDPTIKGRDWTLTGQTCEVHKDGSVITFTGAEVTAALPVGEKVTLAVTSQKYKDNCKFEFQARKSNEDLVEYSLVNPVTKCYRKYEFEYNEDNVKQLGHQGKPHIGLKEDMMPFSLDYSMSAELEEVTVDVTESGHGYILTSNICQYSVLYLMDGAEPRVTLTVGEEYEGAVHGPCTHT